jgi:acyl carrier protein
MKSPDELLAWMRAHVGERLHKPVSEIDPDAPMDVLGLDSMEAVAMTGELERKLGLRIEPSALWEHRTLRRLARFLASLSDTAIPEDEAELDALLLALAQERGGQG